MSRLQAVNTTQGRIRTEILVVAAGIWSPRIGRMAGISIPLIPMQHQYAVTGPLPELTGGVSVAYPGLSAHLGFFRRDCSYPVMGGSRLRPPPHSYNNIPLKSKTLSVSHRPQPNRLLTQR